MERLIDGLDFEVVSVTPAYEVAREHGCRLFHVGDDFVQTDVERALQARVAR
jgi:ribonuclease VapC